MKHWILVLTPCLSLPVAAAPQGSVQGTGAGHLRETQILGAPGASNVKRVSYGTAVAMDGGVAVVGRFTKMRHPFDFCDVVQVYQHEEGRWSRIQTLPFCNPNAQFGTYGFDIGLNEGVLALGWHRDDPSPSVGVNGEVRVHVSPPGTSSFGVAEVLPIPASAVDVTGALGFGESVRSSGTYLVVGAPGDDQEGASAGAVFVYESTGTYQGRPAGWTPVQKLRGIATGQLALFGSSVAIDPDGTGGQVLVVGAPGAYSSAIHRPGAVYVFRRGATESTFDQEALLFASDGLTGDRFGAEVALSGDTILVGAPDRSEPAVGTRSGAAYVFRYVGALGWIEQQKLEVPMHSAGQKIGRSVALDGDVAVVGGHSDPTGRKEKLGRALVYHFDGASWRPSAELDYDDVEVPLFGSGVALQRLARPGPDHEAVRFLVGAPGDGYNTTSGAAYAYRLGASALARSSFSVGTGTASVSAGASLRFRIDLGDAFAYRPYRVLGSFAGAMPGFEVGGVHVPLNPDGYTSALLRGGGGWTPWASLSGTLDASGVATPALEVPSGLSPLLVGSTVHHAALILDDAMRPVLAAGPAATTFVP